MKEENGKRISRRSFLKISGATAAGAAGALSGGLGGLALPRLAFARQELKVGILDPYSGPYADSGKDQTNGALMAVEEFNKRGGVLGRYVTTFQEDTATNPGTAVQKGKKLIDEVGVKYIVGTVASNVGLAVSALCQEKKVVYMSTGCHSDEITVGDKAHRHTFRTTCSNTMLARTAATYIADRFGKKWYFITSDYSWGHTGRDAFKKILLAKGGKAVGEDLTPLGTTDYSSFLLKVRNARPDVLILVLYGNDLVSAVKQFNRFGMRKEMQVGGPLNGLEMARVIGKDDNVGYWGIPWDISVNTKGSLDFGARYKAKYGKIAAWRDYLGYISMQQLLSAIERAKSPDPKKVIPALEGHVFDGLKAHKSYWRSWDHQNVQDTYCGRAKSGAEVKHPDDLFEIVSTKTGDEVAHTRAENPVKLEAL
ncbi:MAG: ABC transporter substrate-binding protein [Deltaproteobacteria bacterium]|nr:ABC transporter substrate-binding protein [Deltaproteobacteria bacterium]